MRIQQSTAQHLGRVTITVFIGLMVSCSAENPRTRSSPEVVVVRESDVVDFEILPQPKIKGKSRSNQIWCATIGLAWRALIDKTIKSPIQVQPPLTQEMVNELNSDFTQGIVSPESFVVFGGPPTQGNYDAVARELQQKFGPSAPKPSFGVREMGEAFVGYAYLSKDLPFEVPFENHDNGFTFNEGSKSVACFGLKSDSKAPRDQERRAQVKAHCDSKAPLYPREFVLELSIKGGTEKLLLMSIPKSTTLWKSWLAGKTFIQQHPARSVDNAAKVIIPKFNLDLATSFSNLQGTKIANPGWSDFEIAGLHQGIRLSLLETGAQVDSDAFVNLAAAIESAHSFVVQQPFLLALLEKDASRPYLLAWFGNDLLLATNQDH
ncbi:MAG: hypothetical protein ACI97A_002825 [Planctomycetota bacterium]|jgi:hypothetical protein